MHISIKNTESGLVVSGEPHAEFGHGNRLTQAGPWARWTWDGSNLIAEVDHVGAYPLFYAYSDSSISISDSIRELISIGANTRFNDAAISAFFILGYFLDEDTPFLHIHSFPPGGLLKWRSGNLDLTDKRPVYSPSSTLSRSAALDEYLARFAYAIEESLSNRAETTVLPLSGGRDSRQILLELLRQRFTPTAIVTQELYPTRGLDDTTIAQELCETLNLPITVLRQTICPFRGEELRHKLLDCLSDEHTWFLSTAEFINKNGFSLCFDGVGPGHLLKGKLHRLGWQRNRSKKQNEHGLLLALESHAVSAAPIFRDLLARSKRRDWSSSKGISRIERSVKKLHEEEEPQLPFFFWNRTRREIAPLMIRTIQKTRIATPYLHPAVFDFLWSLPYDLLQDGRFHDDAITRVMPAVSGVRYSRDSATPAVYQHHADVFRKLSSNLRYWRPKGLTNSLWLAPRMARGLVDRRFAGNTGWLSKWVIWLNALEELQASNGR